MKLIKKNEGKAEDHPPRHFNMWAMGKINAEIGSKRLNVGISHFLPNGGAEMYPSPTERGYFGISGSILVKGKKGDEYVVGPGDMLFIPPGEERSIEVVGAEPATMLVIIVKLD